MMTLTENAAYIKGLAEGLELDATKPEGKLIEKMLCHHLHHMYHRPISFQLAKKGDDTHVLGAAHLSGRFLLEMSLADTQLTPES